MVKYCKCGCKNILIQTNKYYIKKYLNGHYWNGKKQSEEIKIKRGLYKKGKKSSGYKDGRCLKQYYCIDCRVELNKIGALRCKKCDNLHKLGKSVSPKTQFKKNHIPWNKGLTKKTDKRVRNQSNKIKGKNNPVFRNSKHNKCFKGGKYNNIYFRSSWEILYAKYLDSKNIKWIYESNVFDLKTTTYMPDFYLPKTNEYVEIKGYWLGDAKKKFKLFKKLYPKIKIKTLFQKELKFLGIL